MILIRGANVRFLFSRCCSTTPANAFHCVFIYFFLCFHLNGEISKMKELLMLFFSLEPVPLNATMLMTVNRMETRCASKMQINTTMSSNRQPIVLIKYKILFSRHQHVAGRLFCSKVNVNVPNENTLKK